VLQASFKPWVKEQQLGAVACCRFHELTVTTLNNPPVVCSKEGFKGCGDSVRGSLDSDFARLPDNGVKVEVR
jgi:hypothetical protein